jgi:hypothetical protein
MSCAHINHIVSADMNRRKSMKKWSIGLVAFVVVLMLGFLLFSKSRVAAHEHREVGAVELTFGWQVEPVFAGVFNGPELFITDAETQEPVEGAEKTLDLTVRFGSKSKRLELEPAFSDPGHYVASLTPTRPGDYVFELTGIISTTNAISPTVVEEVFTSADGEFGTVELSSDLLFPDADLDPVRLQSQIDALQEELETLSAEVEALQAEQ